MQGLWGAEQYSLTAEARRRIKTQNQNPEMQRKRRKRRFFWVVTVVSSRTLPAAIIHLLATLFDDPGWLISFFRCQRTRSPIYDRGSLRVTDCPEFVNIIGGALQPVERQGLKIFDNGLERAHTLSKLPRVMPAFKTAEKVRSGRFVSHLRNKTYVFGVEVTSGTATLK